LSHTIVTDLGFISFRQNWSQSDCQFYHPCRIFEDVDVIVFYFRLGGDFSGLESWFQQCDVGVVRGYLEGLILTFMKW